MKHKRTKEQNLLDVRRTVAWKRKRSERHAAKLGLPPNWTSDALDMYLEGFTVPEIASILDVDNGTVSHNLKSEALFRLMEQRAIERLCSEEMKDPK